MARKYQPSSFRPGKTTPASLVIGFLFCVGFPAFWTAVAPLNYVQLSRGPEGVRVHKKSCLLFVIPFIQKSIAGVRSVDDRFHAGTYSRTQDNQRKVRSEDESFLVFHNETDQLEVSVSPASIRAKRDQVEAFLADESQRELSLLFVPNWKFSVFFAIPISSLAVLWIVGMFLQILQWLGLIKKPKAS
ncbi:MAG: hypothetical protein H6510_08375 [Acidobacteria bacterium]|nr:hypothetical protein [Acidobacteriota bacterium]MCB9397816.1 hypothetical protein [Acidobacteriota bacterium]